MKHWNRRLLQMLQEFNIKKWIQYVLVVCSSFLLCSCKTEIQAYSVGEWIQLLNKEAGIQDYFETKPYYMNIPSDNPYYDCIQAAVEWQVIEPVHSIDLDAKLNREWVAYTLMNLAGKSVNEQQNIVDISKTSFPDQVQAAIANGLMKVDERALFHPSDIISKDEANQLLNKTIDYINNKEQPSSYSYAFKDDLKDQEIAPTSFDEVNNKVLVSSDTEVDLNTVVHWQKDGHEYAYTVIDVEDTGNGKSLSVEPFNALDAMKDVDISGEEDLNFSDSTEITNQSSLLDDASKYLEPMSISRYTKNFDLNGYGVKLVTSGSSISAKVSKKTPNGTEIFASAVLNHIHVSYAWTSKEYDLQNAYFKITFDSEEDVGVKKGAYKDLYGDFSKVDPNNFLSTITNLFQTKGDAEERTLTLCTLTVPIPSAPVVNVTVNLELHLSASGKAEISLSQTNGIGFEIRNGVMRTIREHSSNAKAQVSGTTKLTAGVRFGLNLLNGTLMDASLNAGAKATVKSYIYLYDSEGNYTQQESDLPQDVVEETAEGNPDILICSNVNGQWVADLKLNSSGSLAGKFGVSKTISLLNGENAPLIPGLNGHYENGQKVDSCTRGKRNHLPTPEGISTTKKITLKEYSMAVHIGNQSKIAITGLPSGYTVNDLVYKSSDAKVAAVDGNGIIYGKQSGSAVIEITTKDNAHVIHCNVIVPEK